MLRPTTAKIRKALFDILGDIQGLSFLDLFAGSGGVGIEAFKKGAKKVVFVEIDRHNIQIIRKTVSSLKNDASFEIIAVDVFVAIKQFNREGKKYEIIFLDPPYYEDLVKKTLQILSCYDIVAPNGLVIAQHYYKEMVPQRCANLELLKQKRYSESCLSFYYKLD